MSPDVEDGAPANTDRFWTRRKLLGVLGISILGGGGFVWYSNRSPRNKLVANDGDAGDWFGFSVATSGDGTTAVIGASRDEDPHGSEAGSAYVFENTDGSLSESAKLTADSGGTRDLFGQAVAMSRDGTVAVIGAPGHDNPNGGGEGAAYVFERTGGEWTQQTVLTAEDGGEEDLFFGGAVAVSNDATTALIGARRDDPSGANSGSAYVFKRSDGTWEQDSKLTAADSNEQDHFGWSVGASGNGATAVIGAPGVNSGRVGSAYVFERTGGEWTQRATLSADDDAGEDTFGRSVAISEDNTRVIIGDTSDTNPDGENAGSAYLFEQSGEDWDQKATLIAADGDEDDKFGRSVAVSGEGATGIVGAWRDEDPNGGYSGSAYVFDLTN